MIRTLRLALVLGALSLQLSACSHAAQAGGSASSNIISRDELTASDAITVYDAVIKLRGNFLTARGRTAGREDFSKPSVFLDGVRYGDLDALRNIPVGIVESVRLYRAWEAQQRFGNGTMGGAIEVTSRK
jgi:hypothetical protein